jgi:hypothetical protein
MEGTMMETVALLENIDRATLREQIESCRGKADRIRRHGPHFVQLHPPGIHLNFWGQPDGHMPKIRTNPHTHDLGFTSTILYGSLLNIVVEIEPHPEGEYLLHEVDSRDGARNVRFNMTDQRVRLVAETETLMQVGDTYDMPPDLYHRTQITEPSITLLKLWEPRPRKFHALMPYGSEANMKTAMRYVEGNDLDAAWAHIERFCALIGV